MGTNLQPDYASPPGDTLLETLDALGLSTADFAAKISLPEVDVRAVAEGKSPIGYDMASRFEEALRIPRDFWIGLENQYQDRRRSIDEVRRRRQIIKNIGTGVFLGAVVVALISCPVVALVVHRAHAQEAKSNARITEARIAGADDGYAAAEQPAEPALAHTIGYVYLGTCDKTWVTRKFGWLPACDAQLPRDGQKIVSWKGDMIRESLPETVNGHRKFGEPVGKVSAGVTVVLYSLHTVSAYQSGPQHIWGKVELPEQPKAP